MRNFIIIGHRAATDPNFTLDDLAGSAGRLDIMARCINSAFFLSHTIRRDVEVALILLGPDDPPKTIRLVGDELKYLNPDERSTGALIRNAHVVFSAKDKNKLKFVNKTHENPKKVVDPVTKNKLSNELRSTPGIYISNNSLEAVLKYYSQHSNIVPLHEDGSEFDAYDCKLDLIQKDTTFILSDHKDFTEDEEEMIRKYSSLDGSISVGPKTLHSDHCIILIHNLLDKMEKRK
jgi:tRNA (pseudouridine54-N1)-methyltransferase